VLPALANRDHAAFSEAIHEYGRRAGEFFRDVQDGPYSSPQIARVVEFLVGRGLRGCGQSSWGPATFAIARDEEEAQHAAAALRGRFELPRHAVIISTPRNRGASIAPE
jgi:predicted sugar kinase